MVHVTTIHRRKVIGEKLQRDHFKDWQKQFRRRGDEDHLVRDLQNFIVAFSGDGDYPASATLHILEDAQGLLKPQCGIVVGGVSRRERDNHESFIDECAWAVM